MDSHSDSPSDVALLPAPSNGEEDTKLARLLREKKGQKRSCKGCQQRKYYEHFDLNKNETGFKPFCRECLSNGRIDAASEVLSIQFKFDKKLTRAIGPNFTKTVVRRMTLYKADALDALHDIAMMRLDDIGDNPTLMQWKYQAAQLLATGMTAAGEVTSGMDDILKGLDEAYRKNAPRIKATRERVTIEFEGNEKLIN